MSNSSLGIGGLFGAAIVAVVIVYWSGLPGPWAFAATIIVLALLVVLLDRFTYVLRDVDAGTNGDVSYSLGRAQMAFWTCLIVGGIIYLVGTKIVTCTKVACVDFSAMKIDPSLLILLGISGVTSVVALAIDVDKDKKRGAVAEQIKELETKISGLETDLVNARGAGNSAAVQESETQLVAAREMLNTARMEEKRNARSVEKKGFFNDILEDSNGNSLHRVQMVIFTILAGVIFSAQVISGEGGKLPAVPTELLELLGISNSVYVGFKIPGK